MAYSTWDQLPLVYTGSPALFAALWMRAKTNVVRMQLFGDSRCTELGGAGDRYVSAVRVALARSLSGGNMPETRLNQVGLSYGGGNPFGDILHTNVPNGGGASRLAATAIPPLCAPRTYKSGDYGAAMLVTPYADCNPDPEFRGGNYWPLPASLAGVSVEADIFAATNPTSGEVKWKATPKNAATAGFFDTATASGTTSLGLQNPGPISIVKATVTLPYSANNSYMELVLTGSDATNPTDIVGARMRNTNAPYGVALTSFSAGGYQVTSFLTNHSTCGPILSAAGCDVFAIALDTNDAFAGNVAADTFKANLLAWISYVRTFVGNVPCILITGGNRPNDGTAGYAASRALYDQYAGVMYSIAQADPAVMFVNSRKATEYAGWNDASEQTYGLTNKGAWSSASVSYAVGDYVQYADTALNTNFWYRVCTAHTSSGTYTPVSSNNYRQVPMFLQDGVHPNFFGGRRKANTDVSLMLSVLNPAAYTMQSAGGNILPSDVRSDTATGLAAGGTTNIPALQSTAAANQLAADQADAQGKKDRISKGVVVVGVEGTGVITPADVQGALAGAGSRINILSPVQSNLAITLRQGVDYLASIGNAVSIPGTVSAGVNVDGTTATLNIMLKSDYDAGNTGNVLLSKTCVATQANQNVTTAFDLLATELAALPVNPPAGSLAITYDVHCAADGHFIPICEGVMTYQRKVG